MKRFYTFLFFALLTLPMIAQESDDTMYGIPEQTNLQVWNDMRDFQYYYIIPAGEQLTNITYEAFFVNNITIGGESVRSTETSSIITSVLAKSRLIRLPEIDPKVAAKTLVFSYATLSSEENLFSTTVRVMIQVSEAESHQLLCTYKSERKGDDYGEALTNALRSGINVILHIPECASAAESTELSKMLTNQPIEPMIWPELSLKSMQQVQDGYTANVQEKQLSDEFLSAYQEIMELFYRYPTIENGRKIKIINDYIAGVKSPKVLAKTEKKLKKKISTGERFHLLYSLSIKNL